MLDRVRRPGSSVWIAVLAVWLAAATVAAAQIASGSLVGDVVDEAGAAVPGATRHRDRDRDRRVAHDVHERRRALRGGRPAAGRLRDPRRVDGVRAGGPRGHRAADRPDAPRRRPAPGRRAERGGDGVRRAAAAAQRDLRPRPRDRPAAGRRSAAQRPQLHRAGQPGAGRRRSGTARGPAAAHQRRPPAHQRVLSSTASRCSSPSRARSRSSRTSTPSRSSRSRATARRPSSAASTAASST